MSACDWLRDWPVDQCPDIPVRILRTGHTKVGAAEYRVCVRHANDGAHSARFNGRYWDLLPLDAVRV